MTGILAKGVPLLFLWGGVLLLLQRAYGGGRRTGIVAGAGYLLGGVAVFAALASGEGEGLYAALRIAGGGWFLLLFLLTARFAYHGAGIAAVETSVAPTRFRGVVAACWSCAAGLTASAFSVAVVGRQPGTLGLMAFATLLLCFFAPFGERRLPDALPVSGEALPLAVVASLLGIAALSPRLNIFTPLTMKVMKFIHDLVHQGFETLLVPDHPFFRPDVWGWIGLLFSKDVGFWGGLVIWFAPTTLVFFALGRARLPSVAHIRQGARRRALLAGYVQERRRRFFVPAAACVVFGLSIYTSLNPMVEYWDPKPVEVTPDPRGMIVLPKSGGAVELEDGRLHKFVYRRGATAARFFVLVKPDDHMTAALDACSICQPQGYGQGEGTVICYYCRTLIPLETVGQPGGCNPVPLPFSESADAVSVDATTLINLWDSTAVTVTKGPGGGK